MHVHTIVKNIMMSNYKRCWGGASVHFLTKTYPDDRNPPLTCSGLLCKIQMKFSGAPNTMIGQLVYCVGRKDSAMNINTGRNCFYLVVYSLLLSRSEKCDTPPS